jgi:predicted nucleic acid-binding protein
MRTAIDTNILSALWGAEASAQRISAFLDTAKSHGGLVISPVVYIEARGHPSISKTEMIRFFEETGITVEWVSDQPLWELAADRFERYTRRRRTQRSEEPKRFPVDFLIASHALLRADRLVTLDQRRYRADFPELNLVEL